MPTDRYIYRTFKKTPAGYETALADALFSILSLSVHGLPEIVQELNRSGPQPQNGPTWTEELFAAEMARLGAYPNSTGTPLGTHAPGTAYPEAYTACGI